VYVNAFNRLIVVLLALAVMAAAIGVFLIVADLVSPNDVMADNWLRDQLRELDRLPGARGAATIASTVAAAVAAALVLVLESLPLWRRERLFAADAEGKTFRMDAYSVRQVIERAGTEVAGVKETEAELRGSSEGLQIRCRVTLDSSASMREAGPELHQQIKAAVERMTGVQVADVQLKLEYAAPHTPSRVS
jgi:hypothetical protein